MASLTKSSSSCSTENDGELRRGPWTLEEDSLLIHFISRHGEGRWNLLAKRSGLKRTGKSCRLRWLNYLKPDVKRGNLTPQEQMSILELHSKWGNRWSKIAQHLPGRTDNEIKNYWRTRVQKQARHLKIDANSTAFQDVIRCYWIPRLLQKIDGSSSSCSFSSQSSMLNPPDPIDYTFQNPTAALPTPPKLIPGQQGTATMPTNYMSGKVQQFDHQELNSDSEHGTTSCISSSESMNISQISQFSDYQTSPFHVISSDQYATFPKEFYHVNNDMETMGHHGDFNNPLRDCQSDYNNWVDYDLGDNMWNMDELWQFRNSLENGNS